MGSKQRRRGGLRGFHSSIAFGCLILLSLVLFLAFFMLLDDDIPEDAGQQRLRLNPSGVFSRLDPRSKVSKRFEHRDQVEFDELDGDQLHEDALVSQKDVLEEHRGNNAPPPSPPARRREPPPALRQEPPPKQRPAPAPPSLSPDSTRKISWKLHNGKSCQSYAEEEPVSRSLEASKEVCAKLDSCVAIECPHDQVSSGCTVRAIANLVPVSVVDCYEMVETGGSTQSARPHPAYNSLLKEYPFQQVTSQSGRQVNIIMVRSQMNEHQSELYEKYKNEILFLGISSMNDYPLKSEHSGRDFTGTFPGFLHMMRPELAAKVFPPHVKLLLMSQSDFQLPKFPARDYSAPREYDFTYSASDCDVLSDGKGWCGWSKNWTFVKEALHLMCGELKLKGVLVATKDKSGKHAYTIPESCKGRMIQTTYLARQSDYFDYLKRSRFAFLPQVHDASPRVSTQALAMDVPILMNYYIAGGWKYVNDQTGEFFHDMSDFRQSLEKILKNADIPHRYEPRKWVLENYDNANSGKRLLEFVREHFSDRVTLPKGTKLLLI